VRERAGYPILSFAWAATPYSVLFLWHEDGTPWQWYVNLQAPLERTLLGFDTVDHALDVLIPPDRSSWSWKDEDELVEAVSLGLFSEGDAAWFRYWGERAVEHLLLRLPPFDRDWQLWAPDPSWPLPELPAGWQTPPG
jgi:predicted RNA-binding protein associated with RNAse of E/G family